MLLDKCFSEDYRNSIVTHVRQPVAKRQITSVFRPRRQIIEYLDTQQKLEFHRPQYFQVNAITEPFEQLENTCAY